MENMNISAVDAAAMETTASVTASAPKHKWLSKLTRSAKKATMFADCCRNYGIDLCNAGFRGRNRRG